MLGQFSSDIILSTDQNNLIAGGTGCMNSTRNWLPRRVIATIGIEYDAHTILRLEQDCYLALFRT